MTLIDVPFTDLKVSALCLGSGSFGTAIPQEEAFALLDRYVELGGNFIDTANVYGNWVKEVERSVSEKVIGRWMQERGNRNSIVIGTKGVHPEMETPKTPRVTPAAIVHDIHQSLASLQVDTIDMYWLHRDDPTQPVEAIIDILDAEQKAGSIRWYGASNWTPARIAEANAYAAASGKAGFSADQVLWNAAPLDKQPYGDPTLGYMDEERYDSHLKSGMAEMPYQSQANGLFNKLESAPYSSLNETLRGMYREGESIVRFNRIQKVMRETGLTITQVVLGYLRGQPFTTIPIIGSRNIEQLNDSMSALHIVLTPEQIAFIGPPQHTLT